MTDETNVQPAQEGEELETVHVTDLDQFIRHFMGWHQTKVTQLEHMLQVPEGIEVTFNEGEPQILKGDLHKGFIIGLSLGLMELGSLPFLAEFEPPSPDEPIH